MFPKFEVWPGLSRKMNEPCPMVTGPTISMRCIFYVGVYNVRFSDNVGLVSCLFLFIIN